MNDQERQELERLKRQQSRLQQELADLSRKLEAFESRLERASSEPAATPPSLPAVPSLVMQPQAPEVLSAASVQAREALAPGLVPPVIASVPSVPSPVPAPAIGSPAPLPATPTKGPSFEMRLGTYWLVRIGIVMLLTGLVFFGNYAYQNYIGKLGAGGKVCLLYLASAVLLGAGGWWQRKTAKESLRNYAQVLFAGGLALVYFTTYAAHHFSNLRVIESSLADGLLLLSIATVMVWIANARKSEVLALFAVLLAYYTSVITTVGLFTLYSNLVLTAAAVFFLVRNRWATLSFASLLATYVAYGFWRFFNGSQWHLPPVEGLATGLCFLAAYWLLFTAGVFLSKHESFARENRASFLTINNGAFFGLFLLTMLQVHHGGFWKFALIYGAALLALAELARRVLPTEPMAKDAYLIQGLLLATAGFITKFSGLELALILATESVALLLAGQQRKNRILLASAYIAALLAVGWGMDGLRQNETPGLWLGIGLGAIMMFNTFLAHRATLPANQVLLRPQPGYFTVLALAIWLAATYNNTSREHFPVVMAGEALLLTISIYFFRVREVALLGQGYLLLAQAAWLFQSAFGTNASLPAWNPLLLLAVTLALSHWWQKQKVLQMRSELSLFLQGAYALAIMGMLYFWLNPLVKPPAWMALTSLLAVGITVYGVFTHAWMLAAFGQLFVVVTGAQFVWQLMENTTTWRFPLAPIAALVVLSLGTVNWFSRHPASASQLRQPVLQLAQIYRWVALGMSVWWIVHYIPARECIWLLALLGAGIFGLAGLFRNAELLLVSGTYTLVSLVFFWLPLLETQTVYLPNLLVILLLLGQRQVARRLHGRYPLEPAVHAAVITIGGLSLWLFLSRWVLEKASGFYLTASWSVLALVLFTTGIILRERVYRWLGLGVLACALGRVVIFDVWKLETLYRILSFLALGVVLLVLGFIYNKHQEKIKEWL
jgi:hypothetical protein